MRSRLSRISHARLAGTSSYTTKSELAFIVVEKLNKKRESEVCVFCGCLPFSEHQEEQQPNYNYCDDNANG